MLTISRRIPAAALLAAFILFGAACGGDEPAVVEPLPEADGQLRIGSLAVAGSSSGSHVVEAVVASPADSADPLAFTHVRNGGVDVPLEAVRSYRSSAAVVLLVDDSSRMAQQGLTAVANGVVQALAHTLDPHFDQLSAVRFADEAVLRVGFAGSRSYLKQRGLRLRGEGPMCLAAGITAAVEQAERSPLPMRTVLVVTSADAGQDAACQMPHSEAVATAVAANVPVRFVQLGSANPADELTAIAEQTGGRVWAIPPAQDLTVVADSIADDLASYTYLRFEQPAGGDGVLEIRAESGSAAFAGTASFGAVSWSGRGDSVVAMRPGDMVGAGADDGEPAANDDSAPGEPPVASEDDENAPEADETVAESASDGASESDDNAAGQAASASDQAGSVAGSVALASGNDASGLTAGQPEGQPAGQPGGQQAAQAAVAGTSGGGSSLPLNLIYAAVALVAGARLLQRRRARKAAHRREATRSDEIAQPNVSLSSVARQRAESARAGAQPTPRFGSVTRVLTDLLPRRNHLEAESPAADTAPPTEHPPVTEAALDDIELLHPPIEHTRPLGPGDAIPHSNGRRNGHSAPGSPYSGDNGHFETDRDYNPGPDAGEPTSTESIAGAPAARKPATEPTPWGPASGYEADALETDTGYPAGGQGEPGAGYDAAGRSEPAEPLNDLPLPAPSRPEPFRPEPARPMPPRVQPAESTEFERAPFTLVGMVCGRYRLEAPLGRGGLGEVYRARDLQFDRTVAVKVLYEDRVEGADSFDSLMREVSLVDRITHPNVVRIYDVIRFEGRVAIVMEYVQGQSLSAISRENGPVNPEEFDAVLTGIAEALDAAHAAGVVHADVTPGNVLITMDGKVKLCDFGIGRLVGDDPTAPRAGTPRFVAPEVLEGYAAGPRADIYSLGALVLMMLAGREADLDDLPPAFATVVKSALEPDPEMRCATAGALAAAFHAAVEDENLQSRGPFRRVLDAVKSKLQSDPPALVDLPPTVSFPLLDDEPVYVPDDPDRTRPLPPPSVRPRGEVTQPMRRS